VALEDGHLQPINSRIDALKASRPYAGGGRPFVEDRLSAVWYKVTETDSTRRRGYAQQNHHLHR
jgi:hypothetical protein